MRKAFGGAFIAMNSRDLGADYTFAWPGATLGVMGAKQAVGIVNRRDIAAADDPEMAREEFAAATRKSTSAPAPPPPRATSTRSSSRSAPAGA